MTTTVFSVARCGGKRQTFLKSSTALSTAILLSLNLSGANKAFAAEAAASAPVVEEVVVTGSRIVRDGYEAPTPVSVIGREQLELSPASDIADYVNTLPSLANSSTPQSGLQGISSANAGINGLNLRSLGLSRTLVLLDGQRVIPSLASAVVDVSEFPQQLVSRVDIVTGGASAAYGSDAIAGVVNFILDKEFTGVKLDVSGSTTDYGDNQTWDVQSSVGTPFAAGRGHFLASGGASASSGIYINDRPWNLIGSSFIANPNYTATNGQPAQIVMNEVAISTATPGGLITAGPLKGTAFGEGGVPFAFNYGTPNLNGWMSGGDWRVSQIRGSLPSGGQSLMPIQSRANIFGRVNYDISDNVNVFFQAAWSRTHNASLIGPATYQGNITIMADNAFLPAEIRNRLAALGQTSFLFGTSNDLPSRGADYTRKVRRLSFGFDGTFDAFERNWHWDAHIENGKASAIAFASNSVHVPRYMRALDAVRDANGRIVCRVQVDNCLPYNVFGTGVNSDDQKAYIGGNPGQYLQLDQSSAAANVSGEIMELWAGAVGFATGFEYRKWKSDGYNDASLDPSGANPWHITPTTVPIGSQRVMEGYVEVDVPLARDTTWADALNLNGAVRVTNYDSFGTIATWKVGMTYSPMTDLRFRGTRSYDFRAPTLADLYASATGSNAGATRSIRDPAKGNAIVNYRGIVPGNPNLGPENADTLGLGVVYQPSWLEGFAVSFDYFDIQVNDGIGSITAPTGDTNQYIVDQCFAGDTRLCASVTRDAAGNILTIATLPLNITSEREKGYDIEASYALPLDTIVESWDGRLQIRGLATHYISDLQDSGVTGVPAQEKVGQLATGSGGLTSWRYQIQTQLIVGDASVSLTYRGHPGGKYFNNWIECQSSCPASTTLNPTVSVNRMKPADYFDLNGSYKIPVGEGTVELYGSVANLLGKEPPSYFKPLSGTGQQENLQVWNWYDLIGRVFRAGVRVRM